MFPYDKDLYLRSKVLTNLNIIFMLILILLQQNSHKLQIYNILMCY